MNFDFAYRPRMLVRMIIFASILLPLSQAQAMTGAELLQARSEFAEGYVFAVVEYEITVGTPDDLRFMQRRQCIIDMKANSGTLLDLARDFVRRTPRALAAPAVGGIIQALNEVCPATVTQ